MKLKFNGFLAMFLLLMAQLTFAQDKSVSGTVTDQSGLPLPGVNVLVKGSQNGVQTDFDGKFKVADAQGKTLVFSFTGMKMTEAKASNGMRVKMADDSVVLEGVVVTAMNIKRQKKALGYGTTSLTSKDLTEVNNSAVFGNLSGKIAGVNISAPAQNGASSKVIIRGFSSFTDSSPLYIVDGSPIDNRGNGVTGATSTRRTYDAGNGISEIDPNSIESMTVLKGAAASALYGSRAANGAIIITTKSGRKASKISVDFSSSLEFTEVARVPKFQYDFGQGWFGQSWSSLATHGDASAENGSWGPAFNGEVRPWGTIVNNSQQIKPYVGLKNNIKDFFEIGNSYNNTFRVYGGGENSVYSLSFSDVNSDGIIPTDSDSYRRRNLSTSFAANTTKFDFNANVNYVNRNQKVVATGSGDDAGEGATLTQELYQIPSDVSLVDQEDYKNNQFNIPDNYFTPYASNPYFLLNENSNKLTGNRVYGNTNFTYKFTPKFSATYQIGGDYRLESYKSYGAKVTFAPGSPQQILGTIATVGGVTETRIQTTELDSYLNFNYKTNIFDKLNLDILLGANSNERSRNLLSSSITGLDIPNYYELSNTANRPVVTQDDLLRRNYGVYSSMEIGYNDKYFLTLTGRNDWSSVLPVKNNSYFYPSASISAILIENNNSFLKLRAGIAKVAKDTDPYLTESSFAQASAGAYFGSINFPIGGVNAYEYSATLGNNELKPEVTVEKEGGFELSLLKKRVNLDFTYYDKKTTDLLFNRDISTSTGFTRQTSNIADISNKGIEIALGIIPIKTKNLRWDINTTFTKNNSNVDKVLTGGNSLNLISSRGVSFEAVEGQPLGVYKSVVPKQNSLGQYIVDANGYYVPTDQAQIIGNSQIDFMMGLQNKINYKNFTLSFAMDWKQGGKMFSESKYLAYFTGNGIETTYNGRNGFVIPNSVQEIISNTGQITYQENSTPINTYVGTATSTITGFYNAQNNPTIAKEFIFDKTFVRMRDLSLTYNLKNNYFKNLGISNVSVSVYGTNLLFWTPKENPYVDPEVTTYGQNIRSEFGESFSTPSQRTYGTTLKLTF